MALSKKVIIIGDSSVGKSTIFTRLIYDSFKEQPATLNPTFKTVKIDIPSIVVKDV